ncbi:SNF2 family helicase [Nitzschia inconspicua]|uniref:SNF2 family helicase n=1 Tax=Nitzschia inconspicua TaxID=303405 RepID=A0A9K3KE82_9STRA|nr:SNF2 family helicase [Nitzschia inconspicua]
MSDFQRKRRRRLERQKHLQDRMEQLAKEETDSRSNNHEVNDGVQNSGRPVVADATEDKAREQNTKPTSLFHSNDKKISTSFYRVDRPSGTKETKKESPTKSSWMKHHTNLHPTDDAPKETPKLQLKNKYETDKSPNNDLSTNNGRDFSDDDDDDDDDDLFGGKSLLAKFRLHKRQQQLQRQGTEHGKTTNTTAAAALQSSPESAVTKDNGLRTTKKGVALDFTDDDQEYQHLSPRDSNQRRRRSRHELLEDTPTPISQENSLNSDQLQNQDEERYPSQDSHTGEGKERQRSLSSDDSHLSSPVSKRRSAEKRKHPSGYHERSTDDASSEGEASDDLQPLRRKQIPRNPIALQREENAVHDRMKSAERRPSSGESDGFMSDCDPPVSLEEKPMPKSNSTKPGKKRGTSDSKGHVQKEKKRARYESDQDDDDDAFHQLFVDNDSIDDGDADVLKPLLSNPKFGPYDLEPLVLGQSNGKEVSVPASLNRYLAPFQREGVAFMYNCLARKSGVILGDEMGLGKTVQVIALLCALFEKTGTEADLQTMRERRRKVSAHVTAFRKRKDDAFAQGKVPEEDFEKSATVQGLSRWHPALVIVPPSVMEAWKQSFDLFSHFSVALYSPKTKERAIDAVRYGSADILLCPKSLFQSDGHFPIINDVGWKLVVIDEFHNYKNEKSKISQNLRDLKTCHMPLVLGMTGTLMQNNHKELWNLVDLVQSNYFGTKEEFIYYVADPIALGRQKGASQSTVEKSEKASKALRTKLAKIMIERKKNDVIGEMLPQKNERVIFCSLSKLQKEVYRHVIELPDFVLVKKASSPCDCGVNQNFFRAFSRLETKAEKLDYYRNNKNRITPQCKCCKRLPLNPRRFEDGEPKIDPDAAIWRTLEKHCLNKFAASNGCEHCPRCCAFPCMTKLMKLSSHVGLLQANKSLDATNKGSPAYVKYLKEREFAKVALAGVVGRLPGGDYDRNGTIMDDHSSLSGKLEVMNTLLQKYLVEGSRVLLFAHSTQTLDLIQNFIRSVGTMTYLRMDGQTDQRKRQALADQFNNDPEIFLFLLSTKATGQGLTLTGANRVILFEQSWNPSWEEQAQDRAHRIGQSRDVDVVRLVAQGTIEEMIYLRQIYKTHLKQDTLTEVVDANAAAPRVFRGVQGDAHRKGELFGFENLFRFKDGSFLEDIWAEAGERGANDASGLRIHQRENLASVLLGIGDENDFDRAFEEKDTVSLIQEMSESAKESTGTKQSEVDIDTMDGKEGEPLEKKIRSVNHEDLFRKDRGGAAIQEGEEGFDEEMGGATQDAYAVYEERKIDYDDANVKELPTSVVSVKSHRSDIKSEVECGNGAHPDMVKSISTSNPDGIYPHIAKSISISNPDGVYPQIAESISTSNPDGIHPHIVKSISTSNPDRVYPQIVKSMTTSNPGGGTKAGTVPILPEDAVITSTSLTGCVHTAFCREGTDQKVTVAMGESGSSTTPQALNVNEAMSLAEPKMCNHLRKSKDSPEKSRKGEVPSKTKIQLAGVVDVDNAKTEFSISDLQLPTYNNKKRKKKKKVPKGI